MIQQIKHFEVILFVNDQKISTAFYKKLLRSDPDLFVPGMTEFIISPYCKLGIMPTKGIAKILDSATPNPDLGDGIPRCELYFLVEDVITEYEYALSIGANLVSTVQARDWGDLVCYFSDPDGHIIAFAQKNY